MATYAIGDLQGCRVEFEALLEKIDFAAEDQLWLLGDLINRGADSLGTLRYVRAISDQCRIVLGNHDLHFLAIFYGGHRPSRSDTFDELLQAEDVAELAAWLCQQRLYYEDRSLGYAMTHAGVPHLWKLKKTRALAKEVEKAFRGEHGAVSRETFFAQLYGNEPDLWDDSLQGMPRLRTITNYLTRMRLVDRDGRLDFEHKGALTEAPPGWRPWFERLDVARLPLKLLFGHWASLDGVTGDDRIIALDTGCVWGRKLTALCLETGVLTQVNAL